MNRDYESISEKFWSLPQKPDEELNRERLFMDDQILHAHLEREIECRLDGVSTVLDAGGGTGRFSLWLANLGYKVTHLDISMPMLEKAREQAIALGISDWITFVHGRITDLSAFAEGQFDLVLSLDAPISYTYPKQNEVIAELVRIAARSVVLCVSSRLGSYPNQFYPAGKKPFLVDEHNPDGAVQWYMRDWEQRDKWRPDFGAADRLWHDGLFANPDEVYMQMTSGETPWPVTYLFRPEELAAILQNSGLHEIRLAGPGALARALPGEILRKLLYSEAYRAPFLERCYQFDSEPSVCGMGLHSLVASGRKTCF